MSSPPPGGGPGRPRAPTSSRVFVPLPLSRVPPPAAAELRTVYDDLCGGALADAGDGSPAAAALPLRVAAAGFASAGVAVRSSTVQAALSACAAADGRLTPDGFVAAAATLGAASRALRPRAAYAVFPDSAFNGGTAAAGACLRRRRALWTLLDEPGSSRGALALAWLLACAVLASVAAFIAGSYPATAAAGGAALAAVDACCLALFTVEYAARLVCAPEPGRWATSFFGAVDGAALLPFYAEAAAAAAGAGGSDLGTGAALLRALRLVRLLRLFRLGRHVVWLRVLGVTLARSAAPLVMLAIMAGATMLIWSTLGYYSERGVWDAAAGVWMNADGSGASQFSSIPAAAWWAVVSMTTVGYGDTVAVTPPGMSLSFLAVFSGIVLASVPISVITAHLHGEAARVEKLRALRREHAKDAARMAEEAAAAKAARAAAAAAADAADADAAATAAAAAAEAEPPPAARSGGGGGGEDGGGDGGGDAEAAAAAAAASADLWSEPFLHTTLLVVRASRRRFMAALKKLELANRERAVGQVKDLVADMGVEDRSEALRESIRRGAL